jgi:uncharacterized protein (TIGR02246 family)
MASEVSMKRIFGSIDPRFPLVFSLLVVVSLSFAITHAKARRSATLSEQDVAAIRAIIEAYRTSWLAGDEQAVLKTLTDDAVLLPHHGDAPVVGRSAITKFWWPDGAPPTKITKLIITIDEVGGDCSVAYARGRDEVSWSIEERGTTKTYGNAGYYLNILRKLPDGTWHISHHMWDDPATQAQ